MDAAIEFTADQAWQAALNSLESEMSRAAFESWVKSVRLVGFENDTFVIGCMDSDGRDWLESRLTTTTQRILTGMINREATVRFVVCDLDGDDPDDLIQEEIQDREDDTDRPIELDIHSSSIRNILLEPWRVVRLPVYSLRWLPYVGSQIVFLVMALWQEYYLASGGKANKGKCKVAVRAERVCQWAGISRAQFFRLLQTDSKFGWFARKIETDHEVNPCTGRSKKSANKYELFDSSLTPGDVEDLKSYLLAQGIKESPEAALQLAVSVNPGEILRYPVRPPPENFEQMTPRYLTVHKVVRELIGHPLRGELEALADQLADRLLAQGEFILVSWYFLKNWLPVLGADAAMFILLLRNLCYFNDETGELRDEVWMDGGYQEIARRLGITNPRAVATWFPARITRGKRKDELTANTDQEFTRRKRLQDLLSLFVERTDHRMNSAGSYAWKFKVQRVDPLTPQHETIRQAVSALLAKSEDRGVLDELFSWADRCPKDCLASAHLWRETVNTDPMLVLRPSNLTNDCSQTLKSILNDYFATLKMDANDYFATLKMDANDYFATLKMDANDCFETLLKILKTFKDSLKDKDTSSNQDSWVSPNDKAGQSVVVTDSKGNWSLEKLLKRADTKKRIALLEQEKNAIPFVSWLIYGASQPNIQNPYSLAIARLKANPGVSAGGACEKLAALSPEDLASLIGQELAYHSPPDRDWRMLSTHANHDRLHLLADMLGLTLDIQEDPWMNQSALQV